MGTVQELLEKAHWPGGVTACAFREFHDADLGRVVDVVLILSDDEWNDETADRCFSATDIAETLLADDGAVVMTACRTAAEHQLMRETEGDIWIELDTGACQTVP